MKRTIIFRGFLILLAFGTGLIFLPKTHARIQQPARQIDFQREIRPILSDQCFACHGPDAPAKKIKLRLDTEAAALADLGRGRQAIVPGNPARSELLKRITHSDESMRMPPISTGRKLSSAEIELLTEWIRQGAKWQQHWSYIPPTKTALPEVKNIGWVKNPIDRFILARLEREGLQPSPEADRATLLRRLSFDLTGLPPSTQELDAFLNDSSPEAYEKVVDRLLTSSRYGERLAYRWLDAARYADTNGYQIDGDRSAWRWRDWVIEAFNQNKPFDQFVIEQLAGDLLPNATLEQKIATGFNRNHRLNAEGGIVPEEYRNEYVVDRVDTTSTVFMGLAMGCARCHNHKYDPFTQKEYYQLSAYFNSIDEGGHSFDQGNSPPLMRAPTIEQQAKLQKFDDEISGIKKQIDELSAKSSGLQNRWEKSVATSKNHPQWFPENKLLVRLACDENSNPVFNKPDRPYHDQIEKKEDSEKKAEAKPEKNEIGFKEGIPKFIPAPTGEGIQFDGKIFFDAGLHADFRYKSTGKDYHERFTLAAWVYPESEQSGSIITKVSDSPAEIENNIPRADGYGLYFLNGKFNFNMVFRWGEDTLRVETENKIPIKQWHHVIVAFDGNQSWNDRLRIYVDGEEQKLNFIQREFYLLFGGTKNTLKFGAGGGPQFRFKGALDEVRIYSRLLDDAERAILACPDSLDKIAALPRAKRTPVQTHKIHEAFIASGASPVIQQARQKYFELQTNRQDFIDTIQTQMVMQEMNEPRPAYILKRGSYDAPGEKVERGVPNALPPLKSGTHLDPKSNRLDFAKWLVSPEHPLTARVAVNRYWQMLFGTGLVKTTEDFGSQGEPPTHPELLDWLAVEFMEGSKDAGMEARRDGGKERVGEKNNLKSQISNPKSPWDVKALIKMMVMSSTYRQSSRFTPTLLQKDPENRLLARGPRVRLSAEMIRDQALFASGLLVEKIGGSSVKPYQPDGLYKDMAFSGLTGYETDKGEGLWRRSLYTYWKRTTLSPTMQVFDASSREFCTVRETRTNTPLQSLNLMNDVTYLEAARSLAQRALTSGGATSEDRLKGVFRSLTSRAPNNQELAILVRDLNRQRDFFRKKPAEAKKLLMLGAKRFDQKIDDVELAAYTTVASLILNLDEVITKQ